MVGDPDAACRPGRCAGLPGFHHPGTGFRGAALAAGRSFRLAWNGPEGYESRTLGAQEQLAQALPELMKSPAQESDPPPWQEAGTVICLCCRVPPDLPENALVLRCGQQGGEPGVFTPEQMPQQIQQWIRSAQ